MAFCMAYKTVKKLADFYLAVFMLSINTQMVGQTSRLEVKAKSIVYCLKTVNVGASEIAKYIFVMLQPDLSLFSCVIYVIDITSR